MKTSTRKLTLSALFLALGLVLPLITGQIPQIGKMLLPMHIPVLLCGMVCGWPYGLAVGAVMPLLRGLLFGMPVLYPTGIGMAFELAAYGAVIGLLTLSAFLFVPVRMLLQEGSAVTIGAIDKILGDSAILAESQTFAFTVLGISQLFHAIGMRNVEKSVFRNSLMENKFMILAVIIGFVLQIAVTEIPFLVRVFGTYSLHLNEWLILTAVSAIPLVLHELLVPVFRHASKKRSQKK